VLPRPKSQTWIDDYICGLRILWMEKGENKSLSSTKLSAYRKKKQEASLEFLLKNK
jgi:hypothetical protein